LKPGANYAFAGFVNFHIFQKEIVYRAILLSPVPDIKNIIKGGSHVVDWDTFEVWVEGGRRRKINERKEKEKEFVWWLHKRRAFYEYRD
jgi:hypothetical protein